MKTKPFTYCLYLIFLMFFISCSRLQTYTVEDINDPDILKYPPPAPVHADSQTYFVNKVDHIQELTVNSVNLRNLSISIENTGNGIIRNPFLFGPQGWDVRGDSIALKALAANITRGDLSKEQKFFRTFEWAMLNFHRSELNNVQPRPNPYPGQYHSSNGSRLFNMYGSAMCGEFHDVVNPILVYIPNAGIYGGKYTMGGHTAGGVFWDGKWHAYNGSPTEQIVHYKMDGKTIATWEELKKDPSPIDSVNKVIGHNGYYGKCFSPDSLKCPLGHAVYPPRFYNSNYLINFRYSKLRPNEKMTMYFDMHGRFDSTSVGYDIYKGRMPRDWVDYGSVVYTYKPNFHNTVYEPFIVEKNNVKSTADGLVPEDPSKISYVVLSSNHYPWYHVGADIKAWFKKKGKVYIGRSRIIPGKSLGADTIYSNIVWAKLNPEQKEYDSASITAKSAFWIKFEFKGRGSGIDSAEIASELQMSPWAMPGLIYGKNYIRFTADDMGGSSAKITYRYDDQSPYYFYEPATATSGKHIYHRLGGQLQKGFGKWKRPDLWVRLKDSADVTPDVTVRLFNIQNISNIRCVRTLFTNKPQKWGYHWWYWDGKDDQGNMLPAGSYAYRIDYKNGTELIHSAFIYLYPDGIWPVPNELRTSVH